MTEDDALDAFVAAGCRALGIPLDPAWAPEVRRQLATILHLASLVAAFPLPDEAEPAPIFRA